MITTTDINMFGQNSFIQVVSLYERVKFAEKIDAEDWLVEQVDSICDIIFGKE